MAHEESSWTQVLRRRVGRRSIVRAGALGTGGVAAAFALACGGGEDKAKGGASPATGAQTPQPQQEQPRYGGTLNIPLPTDPSPNLDPHQTTTYTTAWPAAPVLNQLVQFDPAKPGDTEKDLIADLAERWEQADQTTLVFHLRKDVKWHDGSDFTGEDVKATLDWIKKPFKEGRPSPRSGTQLTVQAIELPDPYTVRIKFTRPTASYLINLGSAYYGIGQAKELVANGEMGVGGKMQGTGPFRLERYERSNIIELRKSPAYHIKDRPYLDGLKFFIVPDFSTRLTDLIAGNYHVFYATDFLPSHMEQVRTESGGKVETFAIPGYSRDPVFMNATRKPYDDVRVRQAISLAINRDDAIKINKQGGARRGGYMAPQGVWAIPESELRRYDGYDKPDLTRARQLLTAAGVTTLQASSTTRTDFRDFGEFLKDQLAKIGITLNIEYKDTATAQPVMIEGRFDIGPWTISINVDDPDATFSELAISKAARNWSRVYDPKIDELYDKQSQIFNFEERKKVVQDLERQALSQYQIAVLYFQYLNHAMAKSVRGYTIHESLYTNRRMDTAWLKT
jgi:peptide/nickel transport system substrate-binding protein